MPIMQLTITKIHINFIRHNYKPNIHMYIYISKSNKLSCRDPRKEWWSVHSTPTHACDLENEKSEPVWVLFIPLFSLWKIASAIVVNLGLWYHFCNTPNPRDSGRYGLGPHNGSRPLAWQQFHWILQQDTNKGKTEIHFNAMIWTPKENNERLQPRYNAKGNRHTRDIHNTLNNT